MRSKKGYTFRDMMPVALLVVVSIIAMSVGTDVLQNIRLGQCAAGFYYNTTLDTCVNVTGAFSEANTGASNATGYGMTGLQELSSWVPTIMLVVAAAIVIGVLIVSFGMKR